MGDNRCIWKYELELTDYVELELPAGAEILCVGAQTDFGVDCRKETLCLWALVYSGDDSVTRTRKFRIAGTGHPITEGVHDLKYIGTVFMYDTTLIWHVFEIVR